MNKQNNKHKTLHYTMIIVSLTILKYERRNGIINLNVIGLIDLMDTFTNNHSDPNTACILYLNQKDFWMKGLGNTSFINANIQCLIFIDIFNNRSS